MSSILREVVIDCRDPMVVGRFWADVLSWPLVTSEKGFCWLSSTGTFDAPPPLLVFVAVPEAKAGKNRLHLDINPSGCEQAEELERLLALGARPVDVGQDNVPWVVLADPEGNEFCLLGRRVDP